METSKEKVLELVATGKISAAEGSELLGALVKPGPSIWSRLGNPFERLNGMATWSLTVVAVLIGFLLFKWNVRFDGALDVHSTHNGLPEVALWDQIVAWPLTALVFWLTSRAVGQKGRVSDFLGAVGVARIPLVLIGILIGGLGPRARIDTSSPSIGAVALVLGVLPLVAWAVVLLLNGFRNASGLREGKSTRVFFVALVVAEILSKVVLHIMEVRK